MYSLHFVQILFFCSLSLSLLALVLEKIYGNEDKIKCTLMNENEKGNGNIIMCFVVIILIYILLVCVHFCFEKCIFVWSYKKKTFTCSYGWMLCMFVCVCEFLFFLGLLLLSCSFFFIHTLRV